jgi:membrane protein implicated in regulation of membrane protease activity
MDELAIGWWIWVVGGLIMMGLEAFLPTGFYFFFLGLAAVATGTLTWLGVVHTLFYQGLTALLSMGVVVAARRPVLARFKLSPQNEVDSMVGETATALESIAAQGGGRVELRGTTWSARNLGEAEIPVRAKCRVERVDGLTLEVRT